MSNTQCKITDAHPVTGNESQPSKLNEELNKIFPSKKITEKGEYNGVNEYYLMMRTDEKFKKNFGFDWTNEDDYKELVEEAINTGTLNSQGEPRLQRTTAGNVYVLSPKGNKVYLNNMLKSINSAEISDIVNSIAGSYIATPDSKKVDLSKYILNRVNNILTTIDADIKSQKENYLEAQDALEEYEDSDDFEENSEDHIELEDDLEHEQGEWMNLVLKRDKLKYLKDNADLQNLIKQRTTARLEKYNFKYVEELVEKEDGTVIDKEEMMPDVNDILNFTLESNETSNRAINDPEILSFLSSIPRLKEYDSSKKRTVKVAEKNYLLGTDMYHDQSAIWGMLEGMFADIIPSYTNTRRESKDVFENYLTELRLRKLESKQPELSYIYDFLTNLEDNVSDPQNFKTKFVSAFFKTNQHYIITQVETKKVEGKYLTTFKIVDPAVKNNKIGKIANEFIETVNQTIGAKDLNTSAALNAEKRKLRKKYDTIRNLSNREDYIVFLNEMLNDTLGLKVTQEVLEYYVDSLTNTGEGFAPLAQEIDKFLYEKIKDDALTDYIDHKNDTTLSLDYPTGELELFYYMNNNKFNNKVREKFKDRLMSNKSFLKRLATAESIYNKDVSESSFLVGGSQRWAYSMTSGLNLQVNNWKKGNIKDLKRLEKRNLLFVDSLLNDDEALEALTVYTNSEIKKENDSNPSLHKRITEIDYHLDHFVKMFNSQDEFYEATVDKAQGEGSVAEKRKKKFRNYIMYNFGADKNSLFALFGLKNPTEGRGNLVGKDTFVGEDFKEILDGYVKGEIQQAHDASLVIDGYFKASNKRDYLMKNLIPGYHYKTKKDIETQELTGEDFAAGQYHKLGIFSAPLSRMKNTVDYGLIFEVGEKGYPSVIGSATLMHSARKRLMEEVYADMEKLVEKNYKYLKDIVLIKKEEDGEKIEVGLFEVQTNMRVGDSDMALKKYIISSFITNYELSNIFNGHISYYKQTSEDTELTDFLKRAPAIATDGKYLHHRNSRYNLEREAALEERELIKNDDRNDYAEVEKTYRDYNDVEHTILDKDDKTVVAIVNSIDIDRSKWADTISKGTGQELNYKYELADAQGYVTASHFKDLVTRIYGWTDYDQKMYDELNDLNHKVNDNNIRWIKKSSKSFTPLKMVHFEVNDQGIPVYLKYSLAALFPAIVKGSEMELISDKMNEQGVEQLVFKSGSKAASYAPTTIHKLDESKGYAGVDPNLRLNPFTIDSNKLKMQVELPTKLDKETKLGIQSIKNIMTNIDMESTDLLYEYKGTQINKFGRTRLTGAEVYQELNDTVVKSLQYDLNSVLKELGYEDGKFKKENIKRLLINQMDIETEQDMISILRSDLPLEAIPNFGQRAFPIISSYLMKQGGKIKTNGGSVVQVANTGYDRLTEEQAGGIFFFDKKKRSLDPPLPVTDKDGNILYFDEHDRPHLDPKKGFMRIKKAKILLPYTSLFEKTGLSYHELVELFKKGDEVFNRKIFSNIMGYRIPNQAISSNDSYEVIGLLPPGSGDQAVVYHEITAKTGSDFDIDKMYLALPHFNVKKKTMLPSENRLMVEKLKKLGVPKSDIKEFYEFMEKYPHDSGTDMLASFLQSDMIRRYAEQKGVTIKADGKATTDQPAGFIINNANEIRDLLEMNNDEFTYDGEVTPLINLLNEIEEAINVATAHNRSIRDKFQEETQPKIDAIYEEFGYDTVESITHVEGDSPRAVQNRIIELMNSILESPASYNDLMSPLDSDIIKDTINKIRYQKAKVKEEYTDDPNLTEKENFEKYLADTKESALEQMMPVSLLKSRVDVLEAKTLISIMANNMTDLGESQKVAFGMKYGLGFVDNDGAKNLSLDRIYMVGETGNEEMKLSKIVSYLMNASVDAAKDNYIISGNFTSYSANGAMLMVRLGMDLESIFSVLMNDEILNFSRYKTYQRAKLSDFSFDYNQEELDMWSKGLILELDKPENENNIFNIISKEDFQSNNPDKKKQILGFWNLIQTMGKEFNDSVVAIKSDANGAGKNINEYIATKNRLKRVSKNSITNSFDKWFKDGMISDSEFFDPYNMKFDPKIESNKRAKMLGAMANNTMFLMEEMSKDLFLETTENVQRGVEMILSSLGNPLETDAGTIKLIYNYLYPSLLRQTGHRIYDISKEKENYLLKEFPKLLKQYKDEFDNPLLDQLYITTYKNKNLISFPNFKNFAIQDKINFKEALTSLMDKIKQEPKYIDLMDDLVQYAFLTTGFKSKHYSMNEHFPASYFLDTFHGKAVQNLIDKLNTGELNVNYHEALTMIAMNHSNNYKIVKKLGAKFSTGEMFKDPTTDKHLNKIDDEKTLEKLQIEPGKFVPFFKKRKLLYMLLDDNGGEPIYRSIKIAENAGFDIYSFNEIEDGLELNEIKYISGVEKLFSDSKALVDKDNIDKKEDDENCNTK